ncbi:MurR/RpiR family transcriptional regulator [Corynebacterium uberis]|uniref:MurR/RpiR family transcriptional regulator n=1 Tax=Corynebacterium uberis TaxID=2883169 RepID=UPI001D0B9AF2|nr:MurR/RpiR family transcriptional regulator [Corynebacterium uberis]UDL78452.1 MurR/RpiR family transcriptional regulator [Corynebacterium uberis]
MNLDAVISATHGGWNDTEKTILTYLLDNQEEAAQASVQHVAHRTFTSTSSVLRLAKRLGFSGFAELKYFLRTSLRERDAATGIDRIAALREDITQTLDQLDNTRLDPILEAIANAGTVYCYATGYSQRMAANAFSKSLVANRTASTTISTATEITAALPLIKPTDLLVIVSLSGTREDAAATAQAARLRDIPVLAVTRLSHNPLAGLATWNLHYVASRITPEGHQGDYYSSIGLSIALDYLIRQYMNYRESHHLLP